LPKSPRKQTTIGIGVEGEEANEMSGMVFIIIIIIIVIIECERVRCDNPGIISVETEEFNETAMLDDLLVANTSI